MSRKRKIPEEKPPSSTEVMLPDDVSGVKALMNKFEDSIGNPDLKVSVTEYIRLVQLEREVDEKDLSRIEVIWTERLDSLFERAD